MLILTRSHAHIPETDQTGQTGPEEGPPKWVAMCWDPDVSFERINAQRTICLGLNYLRHLQLFSTAF